MAESCIRVDSLSFRYENGGQVLSNISFSLSRGSAVALVGANGCGKTTLLWLIAGLFEAESSSIYIEEILLNRRNTRTLQKKLGLAFQNPDDQLFMATVQQDVEFGPRNFLLPEQEIQHRAREAMHRTNCLHLADRPPYRLSGGEKRMVSLATILASDAEILLLDEPTNALDPRARRTTINLLRSLPHTKLIATHDLDMVLDLCDEVILLNHGTIAAKGPSREILSNGPLLKAAGLEIPLSLQR